MARKTKSEEHCCEQWYRAQNTAARAMAELGLLWQFMEAFENCDEDAMVEIYPQWKELHARLVEADGYGHFQHKVRQLARNTR